MKHLDEAQVRSVPLRQAGRVRPCVRSNPSRYGRSDAQPGASVAPPPHSILDSDDVDGAACLSLTSSSTTVSSLSNDSPPARIVPEFSLYRISFASLA